MSYTGSVYLRGVRMAAVYGPTKKDVAAETMHYALLYSEEGQVKVVIRKNRKPKRKS